MYELTIRAQTIGHLKDHIQSMKNKVKAEELFATKCGQALVENHAKHIRCREKWMKVLYDSIVI